MIKVRQKGSFKNMEKFLQRMLRQEQVKALARFGPMGVAALSSATPKESSATANAWYYEIVKKPGYYAIVWRNSHIEDGVPIAIVLQYGHGTRTGGHVEGRNYINPAIQPVMDKLVADMWKVVTK